jgi:hypothetical protein
MSTPGFEGGGRRDMDFRDLGRDGPEVSVLGLGTWPLGGGMGEVDEGTAIATIRAAIDNGVTLIDTAETYRHSESRVGKALRDGYREPCFLATKVSRDFSREGVKSALENSLRTLDVDYVDLYQAHKWPRQTAIEETNGGDGPTSGGGKDAHHRRLQLRRRTDEVGPAFYALPIEPDSLRYVRPEN